MYYDNSKVLIKTTNVQCKLSESRKHSYPWPLYYLPRLSVLSPSVRRPSVRASVRKLAQIPAVVSENVTNKSCLVCVMSEKYAFWVTLRPQSDRCRRGEAEVRILDFKTTWSEFQKASQTATEPESVTSSCVRKHT